MNITKITATGCAGLLLAGLLTGCGKSDEGSAEPKKTESVATVADFEKAFDECEAVSAEYAKTYQDVLDLRNDCASYPWEDFSVTQCSVLVNTSLPAGATCGTRYDASDLSSARIAKDIDFLNNKKTSIQAHTSQIRELLDVVKAELEAGQPG